MEGEDMEKRILSYWVPAFAGMTEKRNWIPAGACARGGGYRDRLDSRHLPSQVQAPRG